MVASQVPWREEILAGEISPRSAFYDNPQFARPCTACGRRFRPTATYFAPDAKSGNLREWCRICDVEPMRTCPACDKRKPQTAFAPTSRLCALCVANGPRETFLRGAGNAPAVAVVAAPLKRCAACKKQKPRTQFSRSSGNPDGLHAYCKPCDSRIRTERKVQAKGEPPLPASKDIITATPVPAEPEKRCSSCRETKPLSAFNRDRSRKDGRQPYCRDCQHRLKAAYRAKRQAKQRHRSLLRWLGYFLRIIYRGY